MRLRRPFVAGNWKMNGSRTGSLQLLQSLVAGCDQINPNVDLAVFPPFVYLELAEKILNETCWAWGAQDISAEPNGAFTGEISAAMLNDFHCRYVIVGHSERRRLFGEDDQLIAKKFSTALQEQLCPILCIGETEEQQANGQTVAVIEKQLAVALKSAKELLENEFVIAYEPVWAIGTGKNASPEQAQEVHANIREFLNAMNPDLALRTRILYGGSVNAKNALPLLKMSDIDGVLVGNASLDANQFIEIGKQCNYLS